jgi:hypothetical protein
MISEERSTMEPAIALDIDGTISQAPDFFAHLSQHWPGKVYVITFREDLKEAQTKLDNWGIRYDELIRTSVHVSKADLMETRADIRYFFEDMDYAIQDVPEQITCFKVRNEENFDFDEGKWQ